jgi:hypothetical protein
MPTLEKLELTLKINEMPADVETRPLAKVVTGVIWVLKLCDR